VARVVIPSSIAVAIIVIGASVTIAGVVIRPSITIPSIVIAVPGIVIRASTAVVVVPSGVTVASIIALVVLTSIAVAIIVVGSSITVAIIIIRVSVAVAIIIVGSGIAIAGIIVPTGVTVASIVVPAVAIIISTSIGTLALTHESVGVSSNRFTEFGMILQVRLQLGMSLHIFFIVDQLRILAKLFSDFAMAIEKTIEADALVTRPVVFATIIAGFPVHERVWIFFQLLANSGVLLHERLQCRMIFDELIVIHERRILSNLFGYLAVGIEELIKQGQFLPGDIAVLSRLSVLILDRCGVNDGGDAKRD
jgi:hypothetical protein